MTNKKPICILLEVYETALKGRSNRSNTHREQPEGERRVQYFCEYIPELRTEFFSVGCDGMALVIVLNEAGVFSAKLGGITGPGSRPKKDRNRAFLHIEEASGDAPDDEYRDRRKLL